MKKLYAICIASIFLLQPIFSSAQLNNGGINAYFGIDGDTRDNYVKYGPSIGAIASDDWFSFTPATRNVIDTTNAAYYAWHLSLDENLSFQKRMSAPLYSKINGKLWLDAVYGRDFVCTMPLIDSTIFTIACKNGDNPNNWVGGSSNVPDKTDIVDTYAHMRRDGTNATDSLWLMTGLSTVGTNGSRYFDIELYKKDFTYNSTTGKFNTSGTEAGHTEWLFDASGKIIQTGDMILAVTFTPGTAPIVDVRIWVSAGTFTSVVPAFFNFGATLDGATAAYGYTSIISKAGTTKFGSGISNFSATPAKDTTYSTPWGTEQSTKNWATQYQSLQLVEIALNLTRMGLDPALYTSVGLSPCEPLFRSIFFKSRSSGSFTSNLQDFMTPLTFLKQPVQDFMVKPDTLRCNKASGSILLTPVTSMGYYTWKTTNGIISSANPDSSQIVIGAPGKYIVSASPIAGCPATRTDTITILKDTFPPIASIFATLGPAFSYIQLIGGNTAASNYPTPFGGSQGLLWNWSGPGGFTSTIQNPTNDTVWGNYQLIVTEKRNGCKDTVIQPISYATFALLAKNSIILEGNYSNDAILLKWQGNNVINAESYIIEKSGNGINFTAIGTINNPGEDQYPGTNYYNFLDNNPANGNNYYRIRVTTRDGYITYSNITLVGVKTTASNKAYLSFNPAFNGLTLVYQSPRATHGTIVMYGVAGEILKVQRVNLTNGTNILPLEKQPGKGSMVKLVSLYVNNERIFTGKMIF